MSSETKKSVTRRELLALTGGAIGAASLVARGVSQLRNNSGGVAVPGVGHSGVGGSGASAPVAGAASVGSNGVSVVGAAAPSAPAGLVEVDPTPKPGLPAGAWIQPPAIPAGQQFRAQAVPLAGPETLAAFGGLRSGSVIGRWTIAAIHEVHLGAIPVVLTDARGEKFQVDVLAKDASVRGVAESKALSFFVSNGGNGSKATAEEQGLAAMALAAVVARRGATAVPSGLLSLTERQASFAGGDFRVIA